MGPWEGAQVTGLLLQALTKAPGERTLFTRISLNICTIKVIGATLGSVLRYLCWSTPEQTRQPGVLSALPEP